MSPDSSDDCAVVFRMLDDYLDRELSDDDIARVERHLVSCAMCASEFRVEGRVLLELRAKVQRIAAPADLHARVWTEVRRRVRSGNLSDASRIERGDSGKKG